MQPSNAEVRAGAVARLKRAASLPRIKGGRRPPMHPEGTSEGEKSRDELSNKQDDETKHVTSDERDKAEQPGQQPDVPESEGHTDVDVSLGKETSNDPPNGQSFSPPPTPTKHRRRSRSRSRSRSKDWKELGAPKTPPPDESSPEANIGFLPTFDDIPVASPVPSRPSPFPIGTRFPFTPTAPSTPVVPTLQDLQQRFVGAGLSRSQSASRAAAMLKLTGGTESIEVTPSPALSRSNTVSGNEQRVAARQRIMMLGRLQHRVGGQPDEALTSGGEESSGPVSKKARRRSRRKSAQSAVASKEPALVDDRDLSTSADTPLVGSTPLSIQTYPEFLTYIPQMQVSFPSYLSSAPSPLPDSNQMGVQSFSQSDPVHRQHWTFNLDDSKPEIRRIRDDVVIEDPDDDSEVSVPQRSPSPSPRPSLRHETSQSSIEGHREPHLSDVPSSISGQDVPVVMAADLSSPYRQDAFPTSPFNTPLKEGPRHEEEEEEEIVFRDEMKARRVRGEISAGGKSLPWTGYTEEEQVVVIQEEDAPVQEPESFKTMSPEAPLPSPSPGPHEALYPSDSRSSHLEPSQSTDLRQSASSIEPPQETQELMNLPNTTGIFQPARDSYTDIGTDYEELNGENPSLKYTKWRTFVRTNSLTGRPARANSIMKSHDKTKDLGAGGTDGKGNHEQSQDNFASSVPPSAWNSPNNHTVPLSHDRNGQPPSAAASILSFTPVSPQRGGPSPIPPASPADLTKYGANGKLTPFPGLVKLDEERRQRSRRMSHSSPNLPHDVAVALEAFPPSGSTTESERRERKLSHQYSDTGLLQKYRVDNETTPSSSTSPPAKTGTSWLPMSRNDLKVWYKINKIFSPSQPTTPTITPQMISSPIQDGGRFSRPGSRTGSRPGSRQQKRMDLGGLLRRPSTENARDVEDAISSHSMTPKNKAKSSPVNNQDRAELPNDPFTSQSIARIQSHPSSLSSADSYLKREEDNEAEASQSKTIILRPVLSAIPEPVASDQSWTLSASKTDSSVSSYKPAESPEIPTAPPQRSSLLLDRLESLLSRDPKDRLRVLEDPPRRMLMSSSLTQVVDSDTIRERFVFIFNDILVVAKPLEPNDMAMNRLFLVKNVIDVNSIQVITSRDMDMSIPLHHPLVLQFVRDFNTHPDLAVASLVQNVGVDDEVALGKLLFNTYDLDRTRLGIYMSKKSRKNILKAFIDSFGFSGVRVDHALRVFMLSIRLPTEAPEHAVEHVLSTFASRWFDGNAKLVTFDRDIAMKLVRIILHLNSQMHRDASDFYQNGYQFDFRAEWEAMVRTIDPRGLLLDEITQDIYSSLQKDPLCWAAEQHYYWEDYVISFKREPPLHIAHRVQSDPIVVRINRPDPNLRIRLLSQDGIVFDPPELNFARSTEATFRITGLTLGPKTIIFSFVGNNAPLYHGLPFSTGVIVERSFMRNTFQIAFKDHNGAKRRYMFSAEDSLVGHQCVVNLRQSMVPKDVDKDRQTRKATRLLSLEILRESLSKKLSGHDLILLCKQNSILADLLTHVVPPASS